MLRSTTSADLEILLFSPPELLRNFVSRQGPSHRILWPVATRTVSRLSGWLLRFDLQVLSHGALQPFASIQGTYALKVRVSSALDMCIFMR